MQRSPPSAIKNRVRTAHATKDLKLILRRVRRRQVRDRERRLRDRIEKERMNKGSQFEPSRHGRGCRRSGFDVDGIPMMRIAGETNLLNMEKENSA